MYVVEILLLVDVIIHVVLQQLQMNVECVVVIIQHVLIVLEL